MNETNEPPAPASTVVCPDEWLHEATSGFMKLLSCNRVNMTFLATPDSPKPFPGHGGPPSRDPTRRGSQTTYRPRGKYVTGHVATAELNDFFFRTNLFFDFLGPRGLRVEYTWPSPSPSQALGRPHPSRDLTMTPGDPDYACRLMFKAHMADLESSFMKPLASGFMKLLPKWGRMAML